MYLIEITAVAAPLFASAGGNDNGFCPVSAGAGITRLGFRGFFVVIKIKECYYELNYASACDIIEKKFPQKSVMIY